MDLSVKPSRFVLIHLLRRIFDRTASDADFRLFLVEIREYLAGRSVLRQLCHAAAHSSGLAPDDKSHREYIHSLLTILFHMQVTQKVFDPNTLSHDFMKYSCSWSNGRYKRDLERIYHRNKEGVWIKHGKRAVPVEIFSDIYKQFRAGFLTQQEFGQEVDQAVAKVIPEFPCRFQDRPSALNDLCIATIGIVNALTHELPWGGSAHFNVHLANGQVWLVLGQAAGRIKFNIYMSILTVESVGDPIDPAIVDSCLWKSINTTRTPPLYLTRRKDGSPKLIENIGHSQDVLRGIR